MQIFKSILIFLVLLVSFVFANTLFAATYYVDYASGADTNNGTATGTPFQHCPGDANATDNADITLSAGDTVNFKGGVYYRGQITCNQNGTSGSKITYAGDNGWGTGKAIIDGTADISFTACPNIATCDNPNWASMYYATLPANTDYKGTLFEDKVRLSVATTKSHTIEFFSTVDIDEFHALSSGINQTTCTDTSVFIQADSDYYTGAYIIVHTSGNALKAKQISSFNISTDTITYTSLGSNPLAQKGDYHYIVAHHVSLIDAAGEYAIDITNSKIYLWPNSGVTDIDIGSLNYAFSTNNKDYITIDGFIIQGQYSNTYDSGRAIKGSTSSATEGTVVQNCTIQDIENNGASGAIYLKGAGTGECLAQSNTIRYVKGRAILGIGANVSVKDNTLSYISGTVIYFQLVTSGEISDNTSDYARGVHANGISVYGTGSGAEAHDVLLKNNIVLNMTATASHYALTWENAYNLTFQNNIFDGDHAYWGSVVAHGGYARFYNNVITGASNIVEPSNLSEITWTNNILDGVNKDGTGTHTYNIYTDRFWDQTAHYGWSLGTGESDETTLANIFTDEANDDFTLFSSSVAVDVGTDLSGTFTTDINGITRPQPSGGSWDIGAYEFEGSAAPSGTLVVAGGIVAVGIKAE